VEHLQRLATLIGYTNSARRYGVKQINVLVLTVAAVLLACPAWSAELAGYWSFDENQGTVAKTYAIKGYDGEIHGAKWVPGKVGSALEFNGDGDYVEVKDTAAGSPFALDSMSISAWINTKAPAGNKNRRIIELQARQKGQDSFGDTLASHQEDAQRPAQPIVTPEFTTGANHANDLKLEDEEEVREWRG
jgi:hypothetical protein